MRQPTNRIWEDEEIKIVTEFYSSEGAHGVKKRLPDRTLPAIRARACKLGIVHIDVKPWSEEEIDILRKWYPTHGHIFVSNKIGRTRSATRTRAQSLGLRSISGYRHFSNSKSPKFEGHQGISLTRWNSIRHSAGDRNIGFHLTIEEAWDIFVKQESKCALSGVPICFPSGRNSSDGTASLDRINPELDYTKENVQWLHKNVNRMKWDLSQQDFIDFCKLVTDKHFIA